MANLAHARSAVKACGNGRPLRTFSLINADTNQVVAGYESISDGAVLNLSTLPTRRLNIRANTDPATVGSVRFEFNAAPSHVENMAPYALCADYLHNYQPCPFSVGNYSIRATPFSGSDASGVAGNPLAISLQFVDQELDTGAPEITGELKKWHRVAITFTGPDTSEIAGNNPFMNYRLDLRFTSPSGRVLTVPGHYAADGNAAESGATSGKKWRAFLCPDETGTWTYVTSFRTGSDVAVSSDPTVGVPTFFDGAAGSFTISASDKSGPDNRARGALRYAGAHYLQFAETGQYFLKAGANSPENLLAYADFDNTTPTHRYLPHTGDFQPGDPSWKGGKGRGLIGALNYLAGKGMNSVHFLTMNVAGDGNDVWPWTSISERYRFDVSKLDQWEIVFAHMDRLGIMLHLNTQETENELLLDNGALGAQRRLYYRELISRFGHHLALTWDLGEENGEEGAPGSGNTDQQRKEFADFFAAIDVYNHPRVVHPFVGFTDAIFNPLLGFPNFEGPSLQLESMIDVHQETRKWLSRSASTGRKWVVTLDEIGPASTGVLPDALDPNHDLVRRYALWGNLLAGGAGVEWYFGTSYPEHDLNCEDWRSRDRLWDITRNAITFLQNEIPFWEFISADSLSSVAGSYVLAKPNEAYVIYLPGGGSTILDLGSSNETFEVRWYDPLNGGQLSTGSVAAISGPGRQSIGSASFTGDAVALVKRT